MPGFILDGSLEIDVKEFFEWFAKGDLMEYLREFTNDCIPAGADEVNVSTMTESRVLIEFRAESE